VRTEVKDGISGRWWTEWQKARVQGDRQDQPAAEAQYHAGTADRPGRLGAEVEGLLARSPAAPTRRSSSCSSSPSRAEERVKQSLGATEGATLPPEPKKTAPAPAPGRVASESLVKFASEQARQDPEELKGMSETEIKELLKEVESEQANDILSRTGGGNTPSIDEFVGQVIEIVDFTE